MAIFCYTDTDGVTHERVFRAGEAPALIELESGRHAFRNMAAEIRQMGMPARTGWPITCYASGVHASQAEELREHFRKHSVPTEVTNDGDPVYRDANHRKKALACRGLHDRSSFC